MTTVSYQGRGSKLQTSADGVTYTSVAQLRNIKFGGLKSTVDKVTNLDSPNAFEEILPTIIDPGDCSYDGVLDPANPTVQSLLTLLQNQTLTFFKVTFPGLANTITWKGYVVDHVPAEVGYAKAITFSGKIMITGPVTIT